MKKGIVGKKLGMTQLFDANGNVGFCVVLFFTSVRLELFPGEIQGAHPTGRDRQIKKWFFTFMLQK